MRQFKTLLTETLDRVLVVKINRPTVLNALSAEVLGELGECFRDFAHSADLGAAVLTGAEGGKRPSFAAGADIAEMVAMSGYELRAHARHGQMAMDAIERAGKPVIAAINGFALGGGLELAMSCHLRYASRDALMGQPEINLGIVPGFGGSQRLPRLVGRGRAYEILLTGDMIKADDAFALRLVDRVFSSDELFSQSLDMAKKMAAKAPLARAMIIDLVSRGFDMNYDDAQRMEADLFGVAGATADVKEGFKAFLEKRGAEFKGQ